MANIGVIGMGKLGLPVALAIESKGHTVTGYDINPAVEGYLTDKKIPYVEEGLQPLLDSNNIQMAKTIGEVVASSDIIFLPVQTPHAPQYEGTTRLPEDRKDFDYSFLKRAVGSIATEAALQQKKTTLAVISTCLPGTFEREIKPLLNEHIDYVYTPQFIAMGTVLEDYLHPEFDLIGVHSPEAKDKLVEFYKTINDAPHVITDITTAEGIKVSYNTWITAKTVIANAWGELSDKIGMNFDDIHRASQLSTRRLLSDRYTKAGMSDGGGCHPRDNIAMSYIADKHGISYNIWEDLMYSREAYEEWHAQIAYETAQAFNMPLVLLGKAFKPETNIQTGSPALLMANILDEWGVNFSHVEELETDVPSVFFVATQHNEYSEVAFPDGSVVIDPFGYIKATENVSVRHLGRTHKNGIINSNTGE